MKVKFADLFTGLGKGELAHSDRAAALAGAVVEIYGWLVPLHGEPGRYALVDRPGACPDRAATPVAAIQLPDFCADISHEAPVRLRGRLSFGFAVAKDGFVSFMRLENARVAGAAARLVPTS
jgi:hypothetical protein